MYWGLLLNIKEVLHFEINYSGRRIIKTWKLPRLKKSESRSHRLYFYDDDVIDIGKNNKLSECGESEITDMNPAYLDRGDLSDELIGQPNIPTRM